MVSQMPLDLSECWKCAHKPINCDNSDPSRFCQNAENYNINSSIVITQISRDLSECWTLQYKWINRGELWDIVTQSAKSIYLISDAIVRIVPGSQRAFRCCNLHRNWISKPLPDVMSLFVFEVLRKAKALCGGCAGNFLDRNFLR